MTSHDLAALHAHMLRMAAGAGLSQHDAQDIVQEAWVRLLKRGWLERELERDHLGAVCSLAVRHAMHARWRSAGRVKRGGADITISLDDMITEPSCTSSQERDHDLAWLTAELERIGARELTEDDGTPMQRSRQRQAWRAALQHCEHLLTH